MRAVWKRLRCWASTGHRTDICELEKIDGLLWATFENCACGHVRRPMWPGYLKKLQHDLSGVTSYHLGNTDTH